MAALNKPVRKAITPAGVPMGFSANGNLQILKGSRQVLFERLVSSFWGKDDFGTFSKDSLATVKAAIKTLVAENDPYFVANTIVFAANEVGMRTFPLAAAVHFAAELHAQKKSFQPMRTVVNDVINRADSLTEMYAYALSVFGSKNKIPLAIKKGVGDAMSKFDEYQYGKYDRKGGITFKDLLRIVHPVPANEDVGRIFKAIMEDKLATPYTWETELSANGQLPVAERRTTQKIWKDLIMSNKVGYMALLRNLRNIQDADVDAEAFAKLKGYLTNPNAIAKSKQFPFAFVNAEENLTSFPFKAVVREALNISAANIPTLGNKVLIFVDLSGSMGKHEDRKSPCFTASLFASMLAIAYKGKAEVKIVAFSTDALEVNHTGLNDVVDLAQRISGCMSHGSTMFDKAVKLGTQLMPDPNVVYVLSDGDINPMRNQFQGARLSAELYKNAARVCFNFSCAQTTPFGTHDNWIYLGGYSDKVFRFIDLTSRSGQIIEMLSNPE